MMIIRPISANDLPALLALVSKTGVGLTTLPANAEELERRIAFSIATFAGTAQRADQVFLFALEDTATRLIVGTAGVAAAVGLRQAWYSYRVGQAVHASQELGIYTQTSTLFLTNDHTGQSELCSLFLDPDFRRDRNGSLLSKARFLFIAQHRKPFSKRVIAELRGVSDADGRSPFWESLGRHFFSMDFSRADYLTGIGKKSFVAELMPKHPLYINFLTPEAQAVIGETHDSTKPAARLLAEEGFRYEGHVDIFDAGPTVECDVDDIDAVARSRLVTAAKRDPGSNAAANETMWLVANTKFADYRAGLVRGTITEGKLALSLEEMLSLGVAAGGELRVVALAPRDRH
jgi:arginine N-succinyltransferase